MGKQAQAYYAALKAQGGGGSPMWTRETQLAVLQLWIAEEGRWPRSEHLTVAEGPPHVSLHLCGVGEHGRLSRRVSRHLWRPAEAAAPRPGRRPGLGHVSPVRPALAQSRPPAVPHLPDLPRARAAGGGGVTQ
jgi:hypothetical protein